jgi:hypothetical protein
MSFVYRFNCYLFYVASTQVASIKARSSAISTINTEERMQVCKYDRFFPCLLGSLLDSYSIPSADTRIEQDTVILVSLFQRQNSMSKLGTKVLRVFLLAIHHGIKKVIWNGHGYRQSH